MKNKPQKLFFLNNNFISFLFLASFIIILASISTYHPLDPSYNYIVDEKINNLLGIYGAYLSSFLLNYFGLGVFLILSFLLSCSYHYKKNEKINYFSIKLFNFLIAFLSFSFVISIFESAHHWPFHSYSGFLGGYLKYNFYQNSNYYYIYVIISVILTLFCFCISHNVEPYNASREFSKILKYLVKKKGEILKKIIIVFLNFLKYLFVLFKKKVFKQRIKDVDPSFLKKSKKIHKMSVDIIPKVKNDDDYVLPSLSILKEVKNQKVSVSKEKLKNNANNLHKALEDFGISGKILKVRPGPVVTLYELEPAAGIKSSRIIGLADDIARSVSAISARIAVIAGKNALGIEMPNENREIVSFKELLESDEYQNNNLHIPLVLGKDISGEPVLADLAKMPHLMVAGTTGSGKSVAINTMILSIVYKLTPNECKFIMIDPKMLELSVYQDIPHLLSPVVTDPKKAVQSLRWAVQEMENRYRLMSAVGVRNVLGYNEIIKKAQEENRILNRQVQTEFDEKTGQPIFAEVEIPLDPIPYIVIIIDEMADLMLVAGKEIEGYVQRLAQMARAAGIHLVLATQRPSVDVITGVIKANFPTRISFQVTSKIDSRTILGEQGAEQLLGMGDMLYMHGGSKITRVHGPFCSDQEVVNITTFLKKQAKPEYIDDIIKDTEESDNTEGGKPSDTKKPEDLYNQAVQIVLRDKKISISYIQRQLRIGYNKAADIVDKMEQEKVVSPPNSVGKREILLDN